jgi:hypothetical protein
MTACAVVRAKRSDTELAEKLELLAEVIFIKIRFKLPLRQHLY